MHVVDIKFLRDITAYKAKDNVKNADIRTDLLKITW